MNSKLINGYNIQAFGSREAFLEQIKDEKKILIAMNAEKILKNDERLQRDSFVSKLYVGKERMVLKMPKSKLDTFENNVYFYTH